ncbi:PQQ-dependent methanol/ethanol family dehydrogenase [Alkalilimnicola ehrlichii]|uniref:PQQ-dependent methanol/ethanol family dehydrogenase n=1 Tax=Alkalilimnicola ehrlichii TaxID=351052 RepID=UPI002868D723|nr:PQQ-dependent methanol/ethanol family dehydrogenase [Alkalilimnicola ehrlichii]
MTQEMIDNDLDDVERVVAYGMNPQAHRYSPLDKLNRDTVKHLTPAWAFSFGGEKQRGQESFTLVHNGVIYVTGSYSRMWAVDARTGKRLWQYEHRLPEGIMPCCDVVNRGAALYDDLVIFGTLDAQLVALDRETGRVRWRDRIADFRAGYSYTAAPMIANDLLITGNSGGEFGAIGEIQARNPRTGEMVWRRPVIEGHMGTLPDGSETMTGTLNATWEGEAWKTGGGAPWLGGTYDPELNLIYFGTGNPAPWNAHSRPGDNLYSSSTLALDADTGEIVWHYQTTPNDHWDYDGVNELVLFDMEKGGETIKAAAKADRNGFFYVLNRETGELLLAEKFVNHVTWAEGIDLETGRPIETGARPGNPAATDGDRGESVTVAPAFLGGKNWNHMSYSQRTGLFYIPSNEWEMEIWNEPVTYRRGAAFLGAGFTIKPIYDDKIGVLRAMDPKTGEIQWEVPNRTPLWSSILTTAGGLVFYGTPEGYLKAVDDETGEELWKFQTGSGVVGQPVTWTMDGEQYVAVVSGWGGAVPLWGGEVAPLVRDISQGGMLWVFNFPKKRPSVGDYSGVDGSRAHLSTARRFSFGKTL